MSTVGSRLRKLREAAGLDRREVADKMKISYWTVAKHENDEREPDGTTLCGYADLYGVSSDYILGRTLIAAPIATEALNRGDLPDELPPEALRELSEYKEYLKHKYGKKED